MRVSYARRRERVDAIRESRLQIYGCVSLKLTPRFAAQALRANSAVRIEKAIIEKQTSDIDGAKIIKQSAIGGSRSC